MYISAGRLAYITCRPAAGRIAYVTCRTAAGRIAYVTCRTAAGRIVYVICRTAARWRDGYAIRPALRIFNESNILWTLVFGRRPNSNQARICVLEFSANRVWLVSRFFHNSIYFIFYLFKFNKYTLPDG